MEGVLDVLSRYGVPGLFALLFAAALGIPSPAALGGVAAGYLVRAGRADAIPLVLAGVIGLTAGHLLSYTLGRKGIGGWLRRIERKSVFRKASEAFLRHKFRTLFLSRWLLTPLALPLNLLAGAESYPVPRFAAAVGLGNLAWIGLYGGVGYALGGTGDPAAAAKWLGAGLTGAGLVFLLVYWLRHRRARAASA